MFGYTLISKKKLQQLKEENEGLRKYFAEINAEILEIKKQQGDGNNGRFEYEEISPLGSCSENRKRSYRLASEINERKTVFDSYD